MDKKMSFSDILYQISMNNSYDEVPNWDAIELMKEADFEDFIKKIAEEILAEEVNINNIGYAGSGVMSLALKVVAPNGKGYIIKIGGAREKFEIPYSENIIQPFIREQVPLDDGRYFTIEVQRETIVQKETATWVVIDENDVQTVQERLKDEGIDWQDPSIGQIGILKQNDPNRRSICEGWGGYIDNGGLDENGQGRSSFVEEIVETRSPEEIPSHVLIDTDFLYTTSDYEDKKKEKRGIASLNSNKNKKQHEMDR